MKDRQPFIFAGLWDLWRGGPEAGELYTFTIIITHPCQFIVAPHSSQNVPVIIDKRAERLGSIRWF